MIYSSLLLFGGGLIYCLAVGTAVYPAVVVGVNEHIVYY